MRLLISAEAFPLPQQGFIFNECRLFRHSSQGPIESLFPAVHSLRIDVAFIVIAWRAGLIRTEKRSRLKVKQYVVDAFTDKVFHGNPAAVCVLEKRLPDELMLSIARENNLSETAFTVKAGEKYALRWFTPGGEIDLCGHATLGTAYVLFNFYEQDRKRITFSTMSGDLTVVRREDFYEMNFPAYDLKPVPVTKEMVEAIGAAPRAACMGQDLLCVFDDPSVVEQLAPDLERLKALDGLLLHATAPGRDSQIDCVSRSFAPKLGIPEDPVCGSGHCHIIPYWAKELGKNALTAYQASPRGGTLYCRMEGKRVLLAGKAALYSCGEIFVDAPSIA